MGEGQHSHSGYRHPPYIHTYIIHTYTNHETDARLPAYLPEAQAAVVGARGDVLPVVGGGEAADAVRVAGVLDGGRGGEGAEVLGVGQLGDEAVRVDLRVLAEGPRAEVEVQAPLEALLEEGGVARHLAKGEEEGW